MTPCNQPNVFDIFTGQDKTMNLKVITEDTGNPLDLSACTEIVVTLPKNDGTKLQRKLSLGQVSISSPAVIGNFTVPLTAAVSALLNVGTFQDILVAFTIGGLITIVRYAQALSVFEAG